MKNQILTLTALASIVCFNVASIPTATAQEGRHDNPMRVFSQLELSDQQKQEIRAIFKTTRQDNSVFAAEKNDMKQDMESLMNMPVWDETLATSLINKQLEQGKSVALNRAKARNQAYNLLTDEQKATLAAQQIDKANMDESDNSGKKDKKKHKKGKKMSMERLAKVLSLSPEQVAQISAIDTTTKAQMDILKDTNKAQRMQMRALTNTATFDEAAWLTLYEDSLDDMLNHRLIRAKAKYEKAAVLSVVQQTKLDKIMQKRKNDERKGKRKEDALS